MECSFDFRLSIKVHSILALLFADHINSLSLCHWNETKEKWQFRWFQISFFAMLGSEYNKCNSEEAKLLSLVSLQNPYAPWQWKKGEQSLFQPFGCVFHSPGGRDIGSAGTLTHISLSKRQKTRDKQSYLQALSVSTSPVKQVTNICTWIQAQQLFAIRYRSSSELLPLGCTLK